MIEKKAKRTVNAEVYQKALQWLAQTKGKDVYFVVVGAMDGVAFDPILSRYIKKFGWCILFVLCWPVAVLAVILFPVVWLLCLPLRLIGITMQAVFALFRTLLFLPARLLGWRRRQCQAC